MVNFYNSVYSFTIIGVFSLILALLLYAGGEEDRLIKKYIDSGDIEGAKRYIAKHYNKTNYTYYSKISDVYEAVGDYDSAAQTIIEYTEVVSDITEIPDTVLSRLEMYNDKNITDERKNSIENKINEINVAKAEKKEAESKAAEEKAAREAAEKAEAERKVAEEKAAKEAQEKEAVLQKEAEESEAALKKETEEKAIKEAEEKKIIENAQTLGVDLVMEVDDSSYEGKYFKTEGTIEVITNENGTTAYLIRYLSTVSNHMRMYKAWIICNDVSDLYVGENLFVVAEYVGFADESPVPTLLQYKMDVSSDSFYSLLSQKAKVINKDVSFENLLRYSEYQEYVYFAGTVTQVYDSCINVRDDEGNYYLVIDNRVDQSVILQNDYVRIYGQFDGIQKDGYVWPIITWIIDGK